MVVVKIEKCLIYTVRIKGYLHSYVQKSYFKGTKHNTKIELLLAVDMENGQFEFMKANQDGKSLSKFEMMLMLGATNGIF
ncbi:hypothetical protein SAMN04487941_3149 [Pontibacter akesuensis]|uniref:Uncharacterized protein n=1 Tax=Pontibacter akesuensis TaxID=388950 RepID=A0A1I7JXD8_9BACT|nr:hypothetical protein GCM10007389_33530 [Pontibacter akesuensis]SFU89834.1 hypothetical protein SAMN04487941_3149 [Pontibacter akesuensis]